MSNFDNIFNYEKKNQARESDFKKRSDGKNRFNRGAGGNRKERPEMFEATCSACGKRCEVPFRPTGDKPVYCSECFSKQGGGNSRGFERRDSGRPRFQDRRMFEAVCDKCGKRFELPFRPTGDKPVYCSECFSKQGGGKSNAGGEYKEQLAALNAKLDIIIKFLTPAEPAGKEVLAAKKVKIVAKKPSKKPARKKNKR